MGERKKIDLTVVLNFRDAVQRLSDAELACNYARKKLFEAVEMSSVAGLVKFVLEHVPFGPSAEEDRLWYLQTFAPLLREALGANLFPFKVDLEIEAGVAGISVAKEDFLRAFIKALEKDEAPS